MTDRKAEFFNELTELIERNRDIPLMTRGSALLTLAVITLEADHMLACGTPISDEEWNEAFVNAVTSVRKSGVHMISKVEGEN